MARAKCGEEKEQRRTEKEKESRERRRERKQIAERNKDTLQGAASPRRKIDQAVNT